MTISFDLDSTLIPCGDEFHVEARTLWPRLLQVEPLRRGTIALFRELQNRGHVIYIYTTSYRSVFAIRKTFFAYGLWPTRIINQTTNQSVLRKHNQHASKHPRLFGIDLHVDDSQGVGMEGERYGFRTVIVEVGEADWAGQVLHGVG